MNDPSIPSRTNEPHKLKKFYRNILHDDAKLSLLMGSSFLLFFFFLSLYFIVEAYHRSQNYYLLNLETDFFQDIALGTKVRYQASLIVGEVVEIQTDFKTHHIVIRLQKNFKVPKEGRSVSLATWGYFGAKFININIYSGGYRNISHSPGDTIQMASSVNPSMMMKNMQSLLKEDEHSKNTLLNEKLHSVKKSIRQLKQATYQNSQSFNFNHSKDILKNTTDSKKRIKKFNDFLAQINKELSISNMKIHEFVPKIKDTTMRINKLLSYKNRLKNFLTRYAYDETDYLEMEIFLSLVETKMERLLQDPNSLFSSN